MTQPGTIVAPQPGWWVRSNRVGANSSAYGWQSSTGGVPSAEAFGRPTITPGSVTIAPAGIASADRFGAPRFAYSQSIVAAGIAPAEAFGAAYLASAQLFPAGIAGAEAFGAPAVRQILQASGIASAEALGAANLTRLVGPAGVAPAERFGAPKVSALAFDAAGVGATGTGTAKTLTWSHTIAANANCAIVGVHHGDQAATTSSAKVGTTSMTLIGSLLYSGNGVSGNNFYCDLFYLLSPPTGAQTISASISASTDFVAGDSASFKGVNAVGALLTNTGSGTSLSHTVSAAVGNIVVQMFGNGTSFNMGSMTSGSYSQTLINYQAGVSSVNYGTLFGYAPGAASVGFTVPGSNDAWGSAAVVLS